MVNKRENSDRWLWVFVAVIAVIRLYLTGDRDILALDSPHDEYWYIQTAFNKIWGGGSYNQMTFIHLPIYSGWLCFLHLFGIPARLAIDVAWLLAIGYLAFAFLRLTRMAWLATLLFAFLAFHPYTISIFDRALAETFLVVVSAAVIGAGIELWNCREEGFAYRRRIALVVYIVGFAITFHTRKEGIILVAPLLVLACWTWFDRQRWWRGLGRQRLAIPLLIAPLLSIIFFGAIVAGGNYLKWGVFARYELTAPGYQQAIAALNRIDVGRTPKYFTVTKEVLSMAYKESPTFRELQPFMETGVGKMWIAISSQNTGIPGEIGNGWFLWALRDVAAQAGWHKDARFADSKYAAAANELENAFATGRLKKRGFTISSFLDPDVDKWMPDVPQSVVNVLKLIVLPKIQYIKSPKESASLIQFDRYVTITGRRTAPIRTEVTGWTILPAGTLIGLGTENYAQSWTRLSEQRADVKGAYGFTVSSISVAPPPALNYLIPDGKKGSIALSELKAGAVSLFNGDVKAEIGVDIFYSNLKSPRANQWLSKLCTVYEWIGYAFCILIIGGVFSLIVRREHIAGGCIVFVVLTTAIIMRIALFGIIDASSFSAIQPRYMLPVVPAFACMGALGLALLSMSYGERRQK